MAPWIRRCVVLMLVFAVPLQGLAGVAMTACAMTHGAEHAAHAMEHDHAAIASGTSHDAHADAANAAAGHAHPEHDCAACAACCSLSAAPVTSLDVAMASPAPSIVIPFLDVRRASVQPQGLERPPSTILLG